MAHVVVYLQRTTRGLHPGSALALCLARDVADSRGATVVSLCLGDAGAFDDRLVVEAGRNGTDQLVFLGPEGINKLFRRLAPRQVFAPYTRDAGSVLAQAGIGPMVGRWIDGPSTQSRLEPVIGVIAGALPWHHAPMTIEPEYEADVTQVELPEWVAEAAERASDLSSTAEQAPLLYRDVGLDDRTRAALISLGAAPASANVLDHREGTLLWFDANAEGLPVTLVERSPGLRVMLLVGEREVQNPIDSSWGMADFVLTGRWDEVVRGLASTAWQRMVI